MVASGPYRNSTYCASRNRKHYMVLPSTQVCPLRENRPVVREISQHSPSYALHVERLLDITICTRINHINTKTNTTSGMHKDLARIPKESQRKSTSISLNGVPELSAISDKWPPLKHTTAFCRKAPFVNPSTQYQWTSCVFCEFISK